MYFLLKVITIQTRCSWLCAWSFLSYGNGFWSLGKTVWNV